MNGQAARSLDDLWTRYLAGDALALEERCSLTSALKSDDVLHRRLLHDLRLDGALKAAAQGERDGEGLVSTLRARIVALPDHRDERQPAGRPFSRPARLVGPLLGSSAVAALVIVALVWLGSAPSRKEASQVAPQARPAPAVAHVLVTSVTGQVHGYDVTGQVRAISPGNSVENGQWLATVGPDARVQTEHEDGTEVDLGGDAVVTGLGLRPGRGRMFVARGRIRVALPPEGPVPGLEVASPHAVVTADGCFRLEVTADQTRIEVQRRRVRVQPTGVPSWTYVRAGQSAVVRPGQPLVVDQTSPGRAR